MEWASSSSAWVRKIIYYTFSLSLCELNYFFMKTFQRMLLASIKESTQCEERMGFYTFRYKDKPVLKVEVLGVLISLEKQEKRNTLIVDDGTATIRCIKYREQDNSAATDANANISLISDDIELGDTVMVQGNLVKAETNESFYDFMIFVKCVEKVEDPNVEIFHWLYCMREK